MSEILSEKVNSLEVKKSFAEVNVLSLLSRDNERVYSSLEHMQLQTKPLNLPPGCGIPPALRNYRGPR